MTTAAQTSPPGPPPDPTGSIEPLAGIEKIEGTEVEYRNVHRVYGSVHALDGLDLRIEPGEMLALLGPSGCGKTTALRMLAGFDQPTSGSVLVGGQDVSAGAGEQARHGHGVPVLQPVPDDEGHRQRGIRAPAAQAVLGAAQGSRRANCSSWSG